MKKDQIMIVFWHAQNYIKERLFNIFQNKGLTSFPQSIYIVPSQRCNSQCVMCLNWREKKPLELPLKYWKKAIDELARVTPYSKINISGGEVLLPGLLQDIAFYAIKKLPYTGIVTNGFLLDKKMVKKVVAARFSNINISIDGNTERTTNMIRGRNYAYKTTTDAMRLLAEEIKRTNSHTKVIIKSIVMGLNIHELPDLVRKVQRLGLHGVYFQPIEPIYNSKQTFKQLKESALWIQKKDKEKAKKIIDELIAMKQRGYPILNETNNLENLKNYFELNKNGKTNTNKEKCEIDLNNLFLLHDGTISFCGAFPPIGNIQNTTIKKALSSHRALQQRHLIRNCNKIKTCMSTCKVGKSLFQQVKMFFMLNK